MQNIYEEYDRTANIVIGEIKGAIERINPEETGRLIEDIVESDKVFLIGVGRVMLSLEAFCKRLSHLGISAHCVGDITEPALSRNSVLIVASGSGESIVPVAIAKKAKELGCKKIVHIGSNPKGKMSEYSDYMVRVPVQTRLYLDDEVKSNQIMTSLFEQSLLIYGDIIAMMLVKRKGIEIDSLWEYHAKLE